MEDLNFPRPDPGAWVRPVDTGYKMECCDCCLVHTLDFRLVGSGFVAWFLRLADRLGKGVTLEFRAYRDNDITERKRDMKFPRGDLRRT